MKLSSKAVYNNLKEESAHYRRCASKHGGEDNPKGHMMPAFFDVRMGAPVAVEMETRNYHEMRVLKDYGQREDSLLRERHALWVAGRTYVDMPFWPYKLHCAVIQFIFAPCFV